jgi:hypothetical protein
MGFFELTAADARAIADSNRQTPSIRAVLAAMRRDPGASPDLMAAVRRAAAEATSPLTQEQISAAFAAAPPRRLSYESFPTRLVRLSAADLDIMFPLRQISKSRGFSVVAPSRGADAAQPANPFTDADGDKLVPIGVAANMLGLTKNAIAKRARKMGFLELVGGRAHIRRRLIDKLYEKQAALASAQA